jgi:hypothetical protein
VRRVGTIPVAFGSLAKIVEAVTGMQSTSRRCTTTGIMRTDRDVNCRSVAAVVCGVLANQGN